MKKIFDAFSGFTMTVCKILLIVEILIASLVVVTRYLPGIVVPTWSEEIILTCMIYMAMLSAAIGLRKNAHIRMTALDKLLPERVVWCLDLFSCVVVLGFSLVLIVIGWQFAWDIGAKAFYASIPALSKFWQYLPVPVSGLVTLLFEIEQICGLFAKKKGDDAQ